MTEKSLKSLVAGLPEAIADRLESEFSMLQDRFARRDWGPAQLNGGRFAEAVLRLLEWKTNGQYTPLGQQVNRSRILDGARGDVSLPESYRFQIPSLVDLLLDFRNKRDVAHLGGDILVNEMDSHLVMRLAAWALAEIVRIETAVVPEDAQSIIDRLSRRRIPLLEEIDGQLVVLNPDFSARERALVLLYQTYPDPWDIGVLRDAVKYSHSSKFKALIAREAKSVTVEMRGSQVFLTQRGVAWVEQHLNLEISV